MHNSLARSTPCRSHSAGLIHQGIVDSWRLFITRLVVFALSLSPQSRSIMIHVIAVIEVQPGTRDRFLAEFAKIVPAVKEEHGCLEYGATVDLPTRLERQAPIRENVVTIVEKWTDVAALEAHLNASHMTHYREQVKDFVVSGKLHILDPAP